MASPWEKGLDFTFGVALLTAEALEQAVGALVERGKVAQENAPAVVEAILEKGRPTRETLARTLREEVWQPIRGQGVPASPEIKALEERVAVLERQVAPENTVNATPPPTGEPILREEPAGPTSDEPAPTNDEPTERADAATTGTDTAADVAPDSTRPEDAAA
jgi:polyhydroxyalkanoate synthesis regulator phasin